ncbi:hypothetical protein B0H11DRAFT_2066541, partial [Mycena galericulata]
VGLGRGADRRAFLSIRWVFSAFLGWLSWFLFLFLGWSFLRACRRGWFMAPRQTCTHRICIWVSRDAANLCWHNIHVILYRPTSR